MARRTEFGLAHYLCLFAHSGVQHILCGVLFVFVLCVQCCRVFSLECPFVIAPSVFVLSVYTQSKQNCPIIMQRDEHNIPKVIYDVQAIILLRLS